MALLPPIEATGTVWHIEIFSTDESKITPALVQAVSDFLYRFEARFSRFREDSLLSQLHAAGILHHPDAETRELFSYVATLFDLTDGVFNPLIGDALRTYGYDAQYSFIDASSSVPVSIPRPSEVLSVSLDAIRLLAGHVDLGGFGKGYLIDALASYLRVEYQIEEFLINGGGDIYATHDGGKPVEIYLEHPAKPGEFVGRTTLFRQGFAASSTYRRRWDSGKGMRSHIIDGRTGESVLSQYGVYVTAPSALMADVWATTLLLSHIERHKEVLQAESVSLLRFDPERDTSTTFGDFKIT